MRTVRIVAVVLTSLVLLSSCYSISQTRADPGYALRHDFSLDGWQIEPNIANSCIIRGSTVGHRQNLCRLVDGYEETGDNRNWIVDFDTVSNPIAWAGFDTDAYGSLIVTDDGTTYEGCDWRSPDNSYWCDYRTRKWIVLETNTQGGWSYVLHKLWDWSRYTGNSLGCASGIAGVWYGAKITLPMLADCADGPM